MSEPSEVDAFARRYELSREAVRELHMLVTRSSTEGATLSSTTLGSTDDGAGSAQPAPRPPPVELGTTRYQIEGVLGRGGQGEVYRVFDHRMGRALAMKVLRPLASTMARARFMAETTLTVGLEHPGIVPIYDRGLTVDGRPWYTMQILAGADFGGMITSDTPLRRRVDVFLRACEAVAYAHQRGVIHRDLKPHNIMIGAFGEVRVLDWGLARRLDARPVEGGSDDDGGGDLLRTRAGAMLGTPRYMPPEQLDGRLDALGPPSDVYALGLILAELLTGERPVIHSLIELRAQRDADLPPPTVGPPALCALCGEMTRCDPAARPADAGVVAEALRQWLDGARKREQAAALVAEAVAIEPTIAALRAEAARLDGEVAAILDPLPAHAPLDDKRPAWALADAAVEKRRAARLAEVELRQTLESALRLDPDSRAASAALSAHYRARLLEAERQHDDDRAAEYRALLEAHDPAGNIEWLRGEGRLTLLTDPPGAEVELRRYAVRDRRLVDVPLRALAATPIVDLPLAMGSYLLVLRAPGRAVVRYPVCIERHGIWDGIPPGEDVPYAIPMPLIDAIGEGECYVPAGWCPLGGDPEAMDPLPRRRVWVDGFVIGRDPVTHGEFLGWLNGLVEAGEVEAAERYAPKDVSHGDGRAPVYRRGAGGRFELGPVLGSAPGLDWPAMAMSWRAAAAFAAARAAQTGRGERLPMSWEWEKAARGVDGRHFPWGNAFEPNWANVLHSRAGPASTCGVGREASDVSPYEVRGLGGNVKDLCADVYRRGGPVEVAGRLTASTTPDPGAYVMVRGGSWGSTEAGCRSGSRFGQAAEDAHPMVGLRLCRPLAVTGR